ncbi:PP2C family protein-serine/threonine phosphatase, partial [Klebsiella pneumoniae]|uniref:PP2C family protein-serine/threonine phosphatase n=1 Tax=Klebsiella pneumoniae TaxID=573 RepID=UPI003EE1C747
MLQRLIELGQYHPEANGANVPRNYLYRSLGQGDEVEIDTRIIKLGVGDTIMICSDGLWDLVSDPQIRATLTAGHDAA